ncbi:MAG: hypothetical protein AB1Z38_02585 [Desulfotignum sp.]
MRITADETGKTVPQPAISQRSRLRGWFGLAAGLAVIWIMAYVILPWGNRLPLVAPIMQAIEVSGIDAGAYWYTQSEETAVAQMYVRHAIGGG